MQHFIILQNEFQTSYILKTFQLKRK